jgi:hypothetical protein
VIQLFMISLIAGIAVGATAGFLLRSDIEHGHIRAMRDRRQYSRWADQKTIYDYLKSHGEAVTLGGICHETSVTSERRVKTALDALLRRDMITSGYPDAAEPNVIRYWRPENADLG